MSSIQQALGFAQSQAQLTPGSQVIWNAEEAQREVNRSLGVNPKLLLSKKAMNSVRVQQMRQAQMQNEMQSVGHAVNIMGKLKAHGKASPRVDRAFCHGLKSVAKMPAVATRRQYSAARGIAFILALVGQAWENITHYVNAIESDCNRKKYG
jgi:hypothetical protein